MMYHLKKHKWQTPNQKLQIWCQETRGPQHHNFVLLLPLNHYKLPLDMAHFRSYSWPLRHFLSHKHWSVPLEIQRKNKGHQNKGRNMKHCSCSHLCIASNEWQGQHEHMKKCSASEQKHKKAMLFGRVSGTTGSCLQAKSKASPLVSTSWGKERLELQKVRKTRKAVNILKKTTFHPEHNPARTLGIMNLEK